MREKNQNKRAKDRIPDLLQLVDRQLRDELSQALILLTSIKLFVVIRGFHAFMSLPVVFLLVRPVPQP